MGARELLAALADRPSLMLAAVAVVLLPIKAHKALAALAVVARVALRRAATVLLELQTQGAAAAAGLVLVGTQAALAVQAL